MSQLTPAMRHKARVLAHQAARSGTPGSATTGSQYELMLYQLAEDRRRLKQIQSIQSRIILKAQLLPTYQHWIDGVLEAGHGGQDDVLTTLLVWSIDAAQYERGLQIARYAIQHKMTLPDQYERDLATLLLDEFSGAYLNGKLADDPAKAVWILGQVSELTDGHDAPDQARAKLYKALAYAQLAQLAVLGEDTELSGTATVTARAAYDNLQRALTLFAGVGVKKDMERLERRLKKAAAS